MKYLISAITLASVLSILVYSQSSKINSKSATSLTQQQSDNHDNHDNHLLRNKNPGHYSSQDEHKNLNVAQAKLVVPSEIKPNTPTPITLDIQDFSGKSIQNFDRFQEQLMHLIVVRNDFQFFQHLHPSYQGKGRFVIDAQFPQAGTYTLLSDYKPTGQSEQVSALELQVPGSPSFPLPIDLSHTDTIADTQVDLQLSETTVKAGQKITVNFNLRDTSTKQPVSDLQPYMGEQGHLVILRPSLPLTSKDYIHAHAIQGDTPGEVQFLTQFPQPGFYKLWGQFKRNGEIITAAFWVRVTEGESTEHESTTQSHPSHTQR